MRRKRHGGSAPLRLALVGAVAVVAAGTVALGAAADRSSATHAKRLKITFQETRLSIQEPPGLGMRQTLLSGTGTFEGFGPATELVGVTIDLTVTPCGAGSSTSTILRRVVVPEGVLVLKSLAHRCPAEFGIRVIGRYEVDGDASTGIFAGARGRGVDTLEVPGPPPAGPIVTISGKLRLAKH